MMSKQTTHTQCRLHKNLGKVAIEQVSWIESKYAKVGRQVKLKQSNGGNWDYGWVVTEVYTERPTQEVMDRKNDHKNMRKMTDI